MAVARVAVVRRTFRIVPMVGTCYIYEMRIIARNTLVDFYTAHPETRASLERWYATVKEADWSDMDGLRATFANAVVLNGERARFEVAGGNYRMICAFYFPARVVFVKFIGTHAQYDRIDALTVSQY